MCFVGSVKSVPLCFKFEPPNLSLHSDCTLNLLNDDKTKTLPSQSGYLPEFAPVYSGKSFVRYELKRKSYGENEFDETDDAKRSSYLQTPYSKDNKLPTQPKRNPTATVASGSCNENENKLLQDVDNPLSESVSNENVCNCLSHLDSWTLLRSISCTPIVVWRCNTKNY